ncbi:thioredoxin domain-containing protein [Candidatus Harpocratesius sp.]
MVNHLKNESSPYLLMHADNPVNWYPYCSQAFEKAKKENKLIFISIGYTACHWCHVMAHESFEKMDIASKLNKNYISIKVDKEERPDVDILYQKFAQIMGKNGGWPLSVFLTPEGLPYFVGTYFPPVSRYALIGFSELIAKLIAIYNEQSEKVKKNGIELLKMLSSSRDDEIGTIKDINYIDDFNSISYFDEVLDKFWIQMDSKYGGFGNAPKFPNFPALLFLIRQLAYQNQKFWQKSRTLNKRSLNSTDNKDSVKNVALKENLKKTLDSMIFGGLYDQIGGGFHRYTVDQKWIIPHFEKMLYDNALAIQVYSEAFLFFRDPEYKRVVKEIIDWLNREMHDKEGGYYASLCADSDGHEGKFYVWQKYELEQILTLEEQSLFFDYYHISEKGNFDHHSNIITVQKNLDELAEDRNINRGLLEITLSKIKSKLYKVRSKRPPPQLDSKIITSWNSLLLSALITSERIFAGDPGFIKIQRNIIDLSNFLKSKMINVQIGSVKRIFMLGKAKIHGNLDDYAYLINSFLIQYLYSKDSTLYSLIKNLFNNVMNEFWNNTHFYFYYSPKESQDLPIRTKLDFDLPIPAPSVIMLENFIIWAEITGDQRWMDKVNKSLRSLSPKLEKYGFAAGSYYILMQHLIYGYQEISFSKSKDGQDAEREYLLSKLKQFFLPFQIIKIINSNNLTNKELIENLDSISAIMNDQNQSIYIFCENHVCSKPFKTLEQFINYFKNNLCN